MPIDARTVYIVAAATCLIVAGGLFFFQVRHFRPSGMTQWIIGQVFQGVAWAFLGCRGIIPDSLSVMVSNVCLTASYSLFYAAVREFQHRSYRWDYLLLPVLSTFLLFWIFWAYTDNLFLRAAYIALLSGMQMASIAAILTRDASIRIGNSQRLTGYIFASGAILWFFRLGELFIVPYQKIHPLESNDIRTVILMLAFGVGMLACIGFLLMTWERTEDDLLESEGKFRALAEKSIAGIYLIQEGRFKYVNLKIAETLGYGRDELINDIRPEEIIFPNDRPVVERNQRARTSGEMPILHFEFRVVTRKREIRQVEVYSAQTTYQGKPALIGTVLDITERKSLEEERRELTERIHRSEKMEALGLLAGSVAHDLNNVLGVLVGYSELLLLKTDTSDPAIRYISNIIKSSERAAAIVNDLLTLARRGVHTSEVINLNDVITEYQSTPEYEKLCAFHPAVRITTRLDADLPNIMGSSVHLGKSVMNLVSNGAEAMPNGGVLTIQTSRHCLEKPMNGFEVVNEGDYAVLSVTDEGTGITREDMKRIFEPFYTKKVMGRSGTGLGLMVVWGTVKDHNGYIDLHTKEGEGTTFSLYFRVTEESISAKPDFRPPSEYMGGKESILVVDDVEEQREMAAQMLAELNYAVVTAACGEEALDYLKKHDMDLILLDMIMDPGMDGLDTYRKIREIRQSQKVILVSGFTETDRVKQAQMLGAGAFVRKPYVMERLGREIRKELDRR
jgi:PAS domain S-box-containing protein